MRAITVVLGEPGQVAVGDVGEPGPSQGALLVEGRLLGICGTDVDIVDGGYGTPPPGRDRLVIGHESLGEVVEAPGGSGFAPGDLVAGIVRRPDPLLRLTEVELEGRARPGVPPPRIRLGQGIMEWPRAPVHLSCGPYPSRIRRPPTVYDRRPAPTSVISTSCSP
ncbi:alcohol dehydrogenase catalytic domain-containing protein [Streptomyces bungoensis]|uniref:alcohol dehydrogenase catalytic domain-containing protein n=1 Tax=Streptomyces bungoensis TaxID=285568 RepID=UPI0033C05D92